MVKLPVKNVAWLDFYNNVRSVHTVDRGCCISDALGGTYSTDNPRSWTESTAWSMRTVLGETSVKSQREYADDLLSMIDGRVDEIILS